MNEQTAFAEVKTLLTDMLQHLSNNNKAIARELVQDKKLGEALQALHNQISATPPPTEPKRKVSVSIDPSRCTSCEACIYACRQDVLVKTENASLKMIWALNTDKCTGCLHCMSVCRYGAIDVTRFY
jgi:ferredoxin